MKAKCCDNDTMTKKGNHFLRGLYP